MRVVIADDSALLREGLARLLAETGVEVCALLPDGEGLPSAVEDHRPDVAIIDIRMPPTFTHEGAVAAAALKLAHPALGVLLLSQVIERQHAAEMFQEHPQGFGYLLKDRVLDVSTLRGALQTLADGGTVVDPEVMRQLVQAHDQQRPLQSLTGRERDVLLLMAEGHSNTGIAETLVLSPRTVETHVASIFAKLGLEEEPSSHRRVLAVLAAMRR